MLVYRISDADKKVLNDAGLTVIENRVVGDSKGFAVTHPILKAYRDYSRYISTGFILYGGNNKELLTAMRSSKNGLTDGNNLVVILKTYSVYTTALKILEDFEELTDMMIDNWEHVEVYPNILKDIPPHLEPRFVYTPKETIYQIKYDDKYYRVTVTSNMSNKKGKYSTTIADLDQLYTDELPSKSEVLKHISKYIK